MINIVLNMFRGLCMALADSVPGVSGGTIAFILGFYDKFITSLNDIVFAGKEKKKVAIKFLLKLGVGWLIGLVLASLVLSKMFEEHIYGVSSVFLGFVLVSIPIIIKQEQKSMKGKYGNLLFMLLGMVIVSLITYFNPVKGDGGISIDEPGVGTYIYVFLVAMVAISAMVLPGISGSTLLLIFGIYMPIMNAIKELLHMNLGYLPILIVFGLGVIVGIVLVIKLIKIALSKFRSQTIYLIVGLMVGSLYAIIMGPTTLGDGLMALGWENFSFGGFILGGAIILGLEGVRKVMEGKETKSEVKTEEISEE